MCWGGADSSDIDSGSSGSDWNSSSWDDSYDSGEDTTGNNYSSTDYGYDDNDYSSYDSGDDMNGGSDMSNWSSGSTYDDAGTNDYEYTAYEPNNTNNYNSDGIVENEVDMSPYDGTQGYNQPGTETPPTPVQTYNFNTNSYEYSVDGQQVTKDEYDKAVETRSNFVDNVGWQGWNTGGLTQKEFAEAYATQQVGLNNKTVQNGNWNSGAWNDAIAEGNRLYDYGNEYESQERDYIDAYNEAVSRGEVIPDYGQNFLGSNPSQSQITDVFNKLGKGYVVEQARFNNPMGNYLGSKVPEGQKENYQTAIDAYNDASGMFGPNFVMDNYGNIGTQNAGQRYGDMIGNALLASKIGLEGLNYTPYGQPRGVMDASTATFKPFGLAGDLLGSQVGEAAGEWAGQQMYNATGNVNQAIAAGMGAGLLGSEGTKYATSALGDLAGINSIPLGSNPATVSKGAFDPVDEENQDSGIGSRLGQADGSDGSSPTIMGGGDGGGDGDSGGVTSGQAISQTQVQQTLGDDFGGGGDAPGQGTETEFDAQKYLMEQAQAANPNTQQITDLYGNMPYTAEVNPLLAAQVPGVQYLSQGRQRKYGTATYNVVDPLTNYVRNRRRGFGNKLTGIVV